MPPEEEVITRRSRGERPAREVHREEVEAPGPTIVYEGGEASDIDPSQALAESRRQMQDTERRLAEERRLRSAAEQNARQATAQAATARQTDRQAVLQSAITGAEGEINGAEAAYRAAREAGDVDAELVAQRALNTASARLQQAQGELAWTKQQAQNAPQQPGQPGPSEAAQAWLDAHPLYFQDDEYQAMAHVADKRALAAGHKGGSESYVAAVEKFMADKYGEGHGQIGGDPPQMKTPSRDRGGELAPTRRATPGGNNGGYKEAVIPKFGKIGYREEAGQKGFQRRVRFASAEQRATLEEFANVNKMSFDDYVNDLILCHEEGHTDLIHGDGSRHE